MVTGAAGFLGTHLVEELLKRGDSVVAVLRPGGSSIRSDWTRKVDLREWDLRESHPPKGLFDGVSVVYHLAARYLPGKSSETLAELRNWNVSSTQNVLHACLEAGIRRFVHLSSIAVCEFSEREIVDEEGGEPATPYGWSKWEAEKLLRAVPHEKLSWTILRPTAVYGEYGRGTMTEITRALQKKRFVIFGGGGNAVNFSYAGNVVAAMMHSEMVSATHGRTYILSDPQISLRELVAALREVLNLRGETIQLPFWTGYALGALFDGFSALTGKRMPLSVARVRAATAHRIYSGKKFRDETGFEPPFRLQEALGRTIRGYREQGTIV